MQLCFKPHLNRKFAQEVIGVQSGKNRNFRNLESSYLGVPIKIDIWVQRLWPITNNTKGEGGGFPQVWVVVSLMSPCMPVVRSCTKNAPTMH
jgi:hypothetical protein